MSVELDADRPVIGQLPPPRPAAPVSPAAPVVEPVEATTPERAPAWWSTEGQAAWRDAVRADPVRAEPRRQPAPSLVFKPVARPDAPAVRKPQKEPMPAAFRAAVGGTAGAGGLVALAGTGWLLAAYGPTIGCALRVGLLLALLLAAVAGAGALTRHADEEGDGR